MKPAATPATDASRPALPRPSPSGFDRLARPYRWLEYLSFGHALERCRAAHLTRMTSSRNALLLGDGDGRFAATLLATNASVHILAIDGSQAMLAQLTRRASALGAADRVTPLQADIVRALRPDIDREIDPEIDEAIDEESTAANPLDTSPSFDLVTSHFFLDCLSTEDVAAVAAGVRQRITPTGQWIISEFEVPTLAARLLVALLYKGFALLTGLRTQQLPAYREALQRLGWQCVAEQRFLGGLLSSTVWKVARPREMAGPARPPAEPSLKRQPRSGRPTPIVHMTQPQVSQAPAFFPYLLDTIPGIDPGPVPSPIPGLDPTDPEPEPDYDPVGDPDPELPPGPGSPGPDPGFPSGPFTDPITT